MGKDVHDEGTKQDERYDEIYDRYISGEMDVDELRKSLSKFPSEYLKHRYNKRQAQKHKSCLSIISSYLKDVWQCTKEMIHASVSASRQDGQSSQNEVHSTELKPENRGMQEEMMIPVMDENNRSDLNGSEDEIKERHDKNKIQGSKALGKKDTSADTSHVTEVPVKYDGQNQAMKPPLDERTDRDGSEDEVKAGHDIENRTQKLKAVVSASHQDGQSSQNESHSTELISENRGMQEEMMIPVMDENNRSDLNGSEDEIKERHDKNMTQGSKALEDSLLDECQRSNTDGLEDESKEEHKTKSKKSMSSNGLVSASHQDGNSSQNESHNTEVIPKNRGMQEEAEDSLLDECLRPNTDGLEDESKEEHKTKSKNHMSSNWLYDIQLLKSSGSPSPIEILQAYALSVRQTTSVSASNQNGKSSQNESHSTELLSENRGMQEEMMDFLLDESKRSMTDGLEDKSKEQHKKQSKNFMSSNGLYDIQLLKPSGSQSPIVDYQQYELFDRQNTRKIAEEIEELQKTTDLKRIGFFNDDGNSLKQLNEKKSHQSVTWTNSRKTKSGFSLPSPEIRRDTDISPKQEFPKDNEDNPDDTENAIFCAPIDAKGNHLYCEIRNIKASLPLEIGHNDRLKMSVFSFCSSSESLTTSFFQLISLIPNDLLASTLNYLDERTYSQTDLVSYEVNPRGRRKYLLFTRFWMVTGDLFSNAISLTAHISNIYYTGIYPTDCRMNLYFPCLIGNYLHIKDEIDDRLPGQFNTEEHINGRSSYLTDCINPPINL